MATDKQMKANRENAKQSTGPRTNSGKTRTSKNALKHGLLAQDAVLPGEDPAEFDQHLTSFEDTYLPRNRVEKEIVRQIADVVWRMQRLSRIETAVIAAGMENSRRFNHDTGPMPEDREERTNILGWAMLTRTKLLNNLARYDAHLGRRFYRAVELMIDIRREERKDREAREAREAQPGYNIEPEHYLPTQTPSHQPGSSIAHPRPTPIAVRENADNPPPREIGFRPVRRQSEDSRNGPNYSSNSFAKNELWKPADPKISRIVRQAISEVTTRTSTSHPQSLFRGNSAPTNSGGSKQS